jgi:hypothetical protein
MRWRVGILIVVALVLLLIGIRWRRRPADHLDASIQRMPVYRPPVPVDSRMPTLDSVLPLRRDSSARRSPPLRGWRR